MPDLVLLFDVDNTLIPQSSAGQEIRPLLFPETTKAVFEYHLKQGNKIVICSRSTTEKQVKAALGEAGIDCEQVNLFCKDSSDNKEHNTDFRSKYVEDLIKKGECQRAIIIDDEREYGRIENPAVTHILVPSNDGCGDDIKNDIYLKLLTQPLNSEDLAKIKAAVNEEVVKNGKINYFEINIDRLNRDFQSVFDAICARKEAYQSLLKITTTYLAANNLDEGKKAVFAGLKQVLEEGRNSADKLPAINAFRQQFNALDQSLLQKHRDGTLGRYIVNIISVLTILPGLARGIHSYAKHGTCQFWKPDSQKTSDHLSAEINKLNNK